MKAFHPDRAPLRLPPGHRFPQTKYRRLRNRVEAMPGIELADAAPADDAELTLVHTPAYVEAVSQGRLSAAEQRAIGFPWSEEMVERARRSVGATVAAAAAAVRDGEGVAMNLAGGTHHASADRGSGYCVFNDVAVAARLHQRRCSPADAGPKRVAVIDLDVHQGDGTAAIFAGDASVFTLSLHGARNFPFRKASSDLDVGLPDGCADAEYLGALEAALATLWAEHARQPFTLAFYLAGADPHEGDRLGRLKLSAGGLLRRDELVFAGLLAQRIPVAVSMAGGYGHDIEVTVDIQQATVGAALAAWRRWHRIGPG